MVRVVGGDPEHDLACAEDTVPYLFVAVFAVCAEEIYTGVAVEDKATGAEESVDVGLKGWDDLTCVDRFH